MWAESGEKVTTLRTGLTTGSCATACSVAAATYLLVNKTLDVVSITLPKGKTVELTIEGYGSISDQDKSKGIRAQTIKDAGDDPDVTHGATVYVELSLSEDPGVRFKAAAGVGTVTREGLSLSVGEPAINPIPRQMILQNLQYVAQQNDYEGGFVVSVGVENGEQIAKKTMNGRLGILGGLSILGTTGIVRPFSCAAWIASIHQGIDVARANGIQHVAASTGNSSESAIKEHYQLPEVALIEMGDFVGAVIKHLKKNPLAKLSICGGIGKISKLANGHMDLNSRVSAISFDHMADKAENLGANQVLLEKIRGANTSVEVLNLCVEQNIDIANALCEEALERVYRILPSVIQVEVWAVDRQGRFVGSAGVGSAGVSV
ncbi:MAG: cobalt-precorrin-5B (C(1))-methyltransferase [Pseudomonadales bacterium]|nr:cobalt-precorrin-5B (C(1))-methyltransferase [Pseudomonadales bacterium]